MIWFDIIVINIMQLSINIWRKALLSPTKMYHWSYFTVIGYVWQRYFNLMKYFQLVQHKWSKLIQNLQSPVIFKNISYVVQSLQCYPCSRKKLPAMTFWTSLVRRHLIINAYFSMGKGGTNEIARIRRKISMYYLTSCRLKHNYLIDLSNFSKIAKSMQPLEMIGWWFVLPNWDSKLVIMKMDFAHFGKTLLNSGKSLRELSRCERIAFYVTAVYLFVVNSMKNETFFFYLRNSETVVPTLLWKK